MRKLPIQSGFSEFLQQSSGQNVSTYSNAHQSSFDMDDHLPPQHSPIQRSSAYMQSNFLQKPYNDSSYDMGRGLSRDQQQRYSWQNSYGQSNNPSGPGFYGDNYGPHLSNHHHQMWAHPHDERAFPDPDGIPQNPSGSHNYQSLYNESSNGYYSDRPKYRRHSTNLHKSINQQLGGYNNFADILDDEAGHHDIHQDSIAQGYDNQLNIYQKNNNNLIGDFDNFQEPLKAPPTTNSTPEKQLLGYESYFNHSNRPAISADRPAQAPHPHSSHMIADSLNCDSMFNSMNAGKPHPITPLSKDYDEEEEDEEDMQDDRGYGSHNYSYQNPDGQLKNQLGASSQPGFPGVQPGGILSQACICNCKKTKCLKLYCECFAKMGYCGEGCHCHGCKNRPENEDDRIMAINEAKGRNPDAFLSKMTEIEIQTENSRKSINESLKKGCNCRRTKCLKKYCECFNAGAFCNHLCKCESCENHEKNPSLHPQKRSSGVPSTGFLPPSSTTSSITSQSRDGRSNQSAFVQSRLSFAGSSSSFPQSSKLGILGLSKYPLTSQSYQTSLRGGPPHSSLIGFVKLNSSEAQIDEKPSTYIAAASATTQQYQRKLLFEGDNDDSEPISSSNPSLSTNLLPGVKQKELENKKLVSTQGSATKKKPEQAKSIQTISDDEDDNEGPISSQARLAKRIQEADLKPPTTDISLLEDLEKKVKEIEQFRLLLLQKQQLQQDQSKTGSSSATEVYTTSTGMPQKQSSTITSDQSGKPMPSQSPQPNSFGKLKNPEQRRQKDELEQPLTKDSLKDQSGKVINSPRKHPDMNQNEKDIILLKKRKLNLQNEPNSQDKKDMGSSASISPSGAAGTAHLSHSETIEDEALSFVEAIDSESKQTDPHAQRSAQTARLMRPNRGGPTMLQDNTSDKEITCQNIVNLSLIAATAKPSELLYDPSSFHTHFSSAFDNFPRNPLLLPASTVKQK